jgi:hypothetical protein
MKGKILFVAGLATGYVLGARAGRERYEQIRSRAQGLWNTPAVQDGVGTVREFALARVGDVSDTVLDGAKKLVGAATRGGSSKAEQARKSASQAARYAKDAVAKAGEATTEAADAAAREAEKSGKSGGKSSSSGASGRSGGSGASGASGSGSSSDGN